MSKRDMSRVSEMITLFGASETAFTDDPTGPPSDLRTMWERLGDAASLPEVLISAGVAAFVFYWLGRARSSFDIKTGRQMDIRAGWKTWAARLVIAGLFAVMITGPGGLINYGYRRHGFAWDHPLTNWLTMLGLIVLSAAVALAVEFAVKVFAGRRT